MLEGPLWDRWNAWAVARGYQPNTIERSRLFGFLSGRNRAESCRYYDRLAQMTNEQLDLELQRQEAMWILQRRD